MRYGYARVSTSEQKIDFQLTALKAAGCDRIFMDEGVSGIKKERAALNEVLSELKAGDTLIVWRLDRMARSMIELVNTVTDLHKRGIGFQSLTEHIDLTTAIGEFTLHILSAVAAFERTMIVERTKAGIEEAKTKGKKLGRRPAMSVEDIHQAKAMMDLGGNVQEIATNFNVGRSTLYRNFQLLNHR